MRKPRIRHGQIGNPTPNRVKKDGTDLLMGSRKLENLYNKAHIIPSQLYKNNYDRIFRKDQGGEQNG